MIDAFYCLTSDNAEVDIFGANLYCEYIKGQRDIPISRVIPSSATLHAQTVENVESILVETGVHASNVLADSGNMLDRRNEFNSHDHQCHREFTTNIGTLDTNMFKPTIVVDNVLIAVEYILGRESHL